MPINTLYHTWNMRIRQLQPMERKTRLQNLTWLIVGIYQSRSVCLSRIAGKIPGEAKLLSSTQRLSRFLANPKVNVRKWYEPIARSWLEMQARNLQQVRLIVDGTKIGFTHQLLIVGLAYRKRSIPIAWTWARQVKGHNIDPSAGTSCNCQGRDKKGERSQILRSSSVTPSRDNLEFLDCHSQPVQPAK